MAGVDAGYLYMETPTMHMHTLKIAVLEPNQPFTFERFVSELADRLDGLPPMQQRALPVPFQLNHPLWIRDRAVDLGRHVFRHEVPAPGGMRELEAVIGEIAGTPLDRGVPLWELHVCEGLEGGRVASVGKMHHALADGVAANALLVNVTDLMRQGPGTPWALEITPSRREQVVMALGDAIRQTFTLPALLGKTFRALLAVARHRRTSTVDVPRPLLDAPRTSFNGALTARRSYATATLPLADLKAARQAHPGVTLNDVVLAVVAGALRRWMDERGEHPRGALVAGVPVATDPPGGPARLGGNRVSNLFTSLATDVDHPAERLKLISETTNASKLVQRTLGPDMLIDWVQFTPPGPFSAGMRLYSRSRAASKHPPPFNVIVSNVRGPAEPVTIAGAALVDLYSVGPILEGIGLNVTAWSYVDRLNVSVLSCPDLVPDLAPLVAQLRPALDDLLPAPTAKGDA
jgi:diacylglycerol O-acyltransferase